MHEPDLVGQGQPDYQEVSGRAPTGTRHGGRRLAEHVLDWAGVVRHFATELTPPSLMDVCLTAVIPAR